MSLWVSSRGGHFRGEGGEELLGGGARRGELRLDFIHQRHQLIDLGDDPALFGEGRNWNRKEERKNNLIKSLFCFSRWYNIAG